MFVLLQKYRNVLSQWVGRDIQWEQMNTHARAHTDTSLDQNVTGMDAGRTVPSEPLSTSNTNKQSLFSSPFISLFLKHPPAHKPTHPHWPVVGHGHACGPGSASLWKTRWRACSGWAGRWSPPPSQSSQRWWWWSEQTPVQLHKHMEREEED